MDLASVWALDASYKEGVLINEMDAKWVCNACVWSSRNEAEVSWVDDPKSLEPGIISEKNEVWAVVSADSLVKIEDIWVGLRVSICDTQN
mgnify:CR=1 FL=1